VTPRGELLHRLALDRHEVAATLGSGRPCGRVLEARSGLSDPHDGGRTVAVVRFASGLRVVYKPRPLGLEAAFHRFVTWWNRQAGGPALFAPRSLDRGAYGLMEFVAHEGCADRAAAGRYWERAGALLAVALLLDATDLHCGNVIAHGEHPVLVDLETLLQPRWPGEERSLLDTGLVPSWIRGPDGGSYDVSGFGAIAPQRYKGVPVPLRENVVRIGDEIVSPAAFTAQLLTGFRRAAEVLCAKRNELVATGGPLQGFQRQPQRVMLRHTETYRAALHGRSAIGPGSLLRPVREPALLEAIAATEGAALRRGDIPHFTATTDRCDWTPRRTSSFAALIARVTRLEPALFEEQARLLTTALALWSLGGAMAAAASGGRHRSGIVGGTPLVQQRHEDEIEDRGPHKQKHDEAAHARSVCL
jgi:class II lanthipeptide synthase